MIEYHKYPSKLILTQRVVALHHCDGPPASTWNRGIDIAYIRNDLANLGVLETCFVTDTGTGANCWGDPHFQTFDGRHYDYQGVGTFNFVTSPVNDFLIQTQFLTSTVYL